MSQESAPLTKRTPSKWDTAPALQEAVDKYIKEDPLRHKAAQDFASFLVDHPQFSQLDNFKVNQTDIVGEELLYQEICKMIRYYGTKPKELDASDLALVKRKLGEDWKNVLTKEYSFELDDFPVETDI